MKRTTLYDLYNYMPQQEENNFTNYQRNRMLRIKLLFSQYHPGKIRWIFQILFLIIF